MSRLSRGLVVDAAFDLAAERGLEAATLRAVAERLGVTPMALYRHVEGKDELLDALADRLYAELDLPRPTDDWWAGLLRVARSVRRLLLARPWATPLFSRWPTGPHGEALSEALQETLRRAGFSRADADELHHQLSNIVFALITPNAAAFERGLALLRPGLEERRRG